MNYTKDVAIAIRKKDLSEVLKIIPNLSKKAQFYESETDTNVIIISFTWIQWDRRIPEIDELMDYLDLIDAIFVSRGERLNDNEEEYYNEVEDLYEHLEIVRYINFKGKLLKEVK